MVDRCAPGIVFAWRRVLRAAEISFADGLLFCWMGVIFVPLLFLGQRQDYYSMSMWSAFALWTAGAWDRIPQRLRAAGAIGVGLVGLIAAGGAVVVAGAARAPKGKWGRMGGGRAGLGGLYDNAV